MYSFICSICKKSCTWHRILQYWIQIAEKYVMQHNIYIPIVLLPSSRVLLLVIIVINNFCFDFCIRLFYSMFLRNIYFGKTRQGKKLSQNTLFKNKHLMHVVLTDKLDTYFKISNCSDDDFSCHFFAKISCFTIKSKNEKYEL